MFPHLEPGSYNVFASTDDRACSTNTNLVLGAGSEITDLKLALEPAAHVRLVQNDDSIAFTRIELAGPDGPVTFMSRPGSLDERLAIQAGMYTVECTLTEPGGNATHLTRHVTLVGEHDEAVVDFQRR
ncbi:MAG: hypothetical protein U1E76_24310 [Planctomycetota bacterium]